MSGGAHPNLNKQPALPGWPSPLPVKLKWLEPRIEQVVFTRAEVVVYWGKALAKAKDAAIKGLSTDTALESAYSAGRLAALAVLASRHIRITAKSGHHELTFSAVAALGLKGCDDLVAESEEVRLARHNADYLAETASPEEVQHALAWMRRTMPLLRAALIQGDPELASELGSPGS